MLSNIYVIDRNMCLFNFIYSNTTANQKWSFPCCISKTGNGVLDPQRYETTTPGFLGRCWLDT